MIHSYLVSYSPIFSSQIAIHFTKYHCTPHFRRRSTGSFWRLSIHISIFLCTSWIIPVCFIVQTHPTPPPTAPKKCTPFSYVLFCRGCFICSVRSEFMWLTLSMFFRDALVVLQKSYRIVVSVKVKKTNMILVKWLDIEPQQNTKMGEPFVWFLECYIPIYEWRCYHVWLYYASVVSKCPTNHAHALLCLC